MPGGRFEKALGWLVQPQQGPKPTLPWGPLLPGTCKDGCFPQPCGLQSPSVNAPGTGKTPNDSRESGRPSSPQGFSCKAPQALWPPYAHHTWAWRGGEDKAGQGITDQPDPPLRGAGCWSRSHLSSRRHPDVPGGTTLLRGEVLLPGELGGSRDMVGGSGHAGV